MRDAIDPGGDVLDSASPELKRIRNELRQKRQKLRGTLEQYTRGASSKYLQDEVITERNGRFVLMVRAEHRGNVPGIVHGSSTTGATLFMEPAATVEINNDIVELEDREREEIFRILLELTDRFRARPADLVVSRDVAREIDVLQAKARYSSKVNGIEPEFTIDTSLQLEGGAPPDARTRGPGRRAARSAESRAAHHRAEHGRQDGGAQDRRPVCLDGAGRPACAGDGGAAAGVPVGVCRHRRRAVDRSQPQHVLVAHQEPGVDGTRPAVAGAGPAR